MSHTVYAAFSCHKEKNTNPEDMTELHISQYCIIMGKVHSNVTVSDEDKFYLHCTVYLSTEKSVNYQLLTWQGGYSIDPNNSNHR